MKDGEYMLDVKFYEVFLEEEKAIKKFWPSKYNAQFTLKTVQESNDDVVPAKIISVRTQSYIPLEWSDFLKGIFSRSQGFDHLIKYKKESNTLASCGYLESYCSRAVAEHALLAMMFLYRKIKSQIKCFDCFQRDGLTGTEVKEKKAFGCGSW